MLLILLKILLFIQDVKDIKKYNYQNKNGKTQQILVQIFNTNFK